MARSSFVFSELPNYDVIIPALFKYDLEDIQDHIKLTPGTHPTHVHMYACTCACGIVVHMHSTSERKNLVYSIIQYVYTILIRVRHSHQTWQMRIFCTEGWAQIVGQILSSGCAVIVTAT